MKKSRRKKVVRGSFDLLVDIEILSLAHEAGVPEQIDAPGLIRGVGFRIGERRLVAPFDDVIEIISLPVITAVPGGQAWLLGVSNIRGTLVPVVDLKLLMDGERTVIHETQRALTIRQSGGNVAILIDELLGQRNFNERDRIPADLDAAGPYGSFVRETFRVGESDYLLFDMHALTRTPEFRQAAA